MHEPELKLKLEDAGISFFKDNASNKFKLK